METMTRDEMVRAIQRQLGVDHREAQRIADRQFAPNRHAAPSLLRGPLRRPAPTPAPDPDGRTLVLPVSLVIPWSHLVSDDDKYGVLSGRIILKQRYREMKSAIRTRARKQIGDVLPVTYPVALEAIVWVPDNRRRDCINFAKLVHDALETVLYRNDSQLWRATWERAGVDVDAPRAEVRITPYLGRT